MTDRYKYDRSLEESYCIKPYVASVNSDYPLDSILWAVYVKVPKDYSDGIHNWLCLPADDAEAEYKWYPNGSSSDTYVDALRRIREDMIPPARAQKKVANVTIYAPFPDEVMM
jgi:hypothetical protein